MIREYGGHILNFDSRIRDWRQPNDPMVIKAEDRQFLDSYNILFRFTGDWVVSVDYGDGNPVYYDRSYNNSSYLFLQDTIETNNTGDITIKVETPQYLRQLRFISFDLSNGHKASFDFPFRQYFNLQSIEVWANYFDEFDFPQIVSLPSLTTLDFNVQNSYLPLPVVLSNVRILTLRSADVYKSSDFDADNWNSIGLLKSLRELTIYGLSDANGQDKYLPSSISECGNLYRITHTGLSGKGYLDRIPDVINTIDSLTRYQCTDIVAGWGNMLNIAPNLEALDIRAGDYNTPHNNCLPSTLPDWLELAVKLKNLRVRGFGANAVDPQQHIDDFFNNFYDFTVANASIIGNNTSYFRGLAINTSGFNSEKPTGIYQQPTDYIQGANNGTPGTPQERIFVLVNQYGYAITTS